MADNFMTLFCLVDGESTPFPVEIESTKTIGELKKAIKAEKVNDFSDVDADKLTLWKVSISVLPKKERKEISLADIPSKEETDDVSDVFKEQPPKKTIHIIVRRSQPVHAPVPARASAPLPDHLWDESSEKHRQDRRG
ncbi:hypothetical protein BG003_003172 [Podila horticola]|nr:hypothetical protein BG003_003172 [Podila horticola]